VDVELLANAGLLGDGGLGLLLGDQPDRLRVAVSGFATRLRGGLLSLCGSRS